MQSNSCDPQNAVDIFNVTFNVPISAMVPVILFQIGLIVLFSTSYVVSKNLKKS